MIIFHIFVLVQLNIFTMLSNEEIADKMLSDIPAYQEDIKNIIISRLMDSSNSRTYWDAWFRGATGKDLENADKGIIYKKSLMLKLKKYLS